MQTDLTWRTEHRKINQLVPHDRNPRKMSDQQISDLRASIEKFNLVELPAVDADNTILAGHMRLRVMELIGRGEEKIEVRVPNRKLTEAERQEYMLRSNKNIGEWDWSLLANLDESILLAAGFTQEELLVGFGLDDADKADVDAARISLLAVYPPEAPKLKERAQIHFESFEDYVKVKEAIEDGRITPDAMLRLL